MFDYRDYPLFGRWYSKHRGASLAGMSFRREFGRMAIALSVAAAIFHVFYGWIF